MKTNKFRSWNDVDKCFYYFQDGKYLDKNNEEIDKHCFNWNNAEQFTEVKDKDKNKKEIYEGDIIKINGNFLCGRGFHVDVVNPIFVVIFRNGRFALDLLSNSYNVVISICDFLSQLEVIGNIHENPELIEV